MKKYIKKIKAFARNLYGWIRSQYICRLAGIGRPWHFYGFRHWEMACRYADKRSRKWPGKWDQLGRPQGVFPYKDEVLLVGSKADLKYFQKMGLLSSHRNYTKFFRTAYYRTDKPSQTI